MTTTMTTTMTTPTQGNMSVNTTAGCFVPWKMPGETPAMKIYLPILLGIIVLTSVVGNTLVIRGVLLTKVKPPSYYLILNLAIAELFGTILAPFYFHYWSEPFEWVFGEGMCKVVDMFQVCCYLIVSLMLACLSVYFFRVVISPKKNRPSRLASCFLVAFSWVWGIALAFPTSLAKKIWKGPKCSGGDLYHCQMQFPSKTMEHAINILLLLVQLIIPFLVMGLCYGIVIIKLKQHIKTIKEDAQEMSEMNTAHSDDLTCTTEEPRSSLATSTENPQGNNQSSRMIKMEKRLLKAIYCMILIYFLCYTPDHVIYIGNYSSGWSHYHIFRKHLRLLHALPAAIHPFIYGFLSCIIQRNFSCC